MANTGEPLIHVVRSNKPKGLRGLNHKGGGPVEAFPLRLPQMGGHRRTGGASLVHGARAQRGKPVSLPPGKASRKGSRWGCGYGTREKAQAIRSWGGEGVRPTQHHPTRKRADVPGGSCITRDVGQPTEETKQLTAVATPAGAVSHNTVEWHALTWQKAHRMVRRLQPRIVKATQAGRWGKVQALQRLLTRSLSATVLAIKRVTDNQGTRTPGGEGVIWETPESKAQAVATRRQQGYRPLPLRRVAIPTSGGTGTRPLSMPGMQDRAVQARYLRARDPIAATRAAPNASGFRLERSTADALDPCPRVWSPKRSAPWIGEGDIRSCGDSFAPDWLVAHLPMDTAILQTWRKAGGMDTHRLYAPEAGVPPGGVMSPGIMHRALPGVARHVTGALPTSQDTQRTPVHVLRCADDCIITGRSQDVLEQAAQPLGAQVLATRGLERSPEKTRVTPMEEGCDLLGTRVRTYRGKLFWTPAKKNVRAFLDTIRGVVQGHKHASTGNVMMQRHPVMRGWAPSHQQGASTRTFAKGDHHIFTRLGPWARRRHPRTSRDGIRDTSFRSENGNNGVFLGHVTRSKGTPQDVRLCRASSVPMRRHTKIKGEANPYDPPGEPYLEARLGVRLAHNLKGRRHLFRLWKEHDGLCVVCHQRMTKLSGWHSHHLVWRTHGGADRAANRVLLHPNGHAQVHSHGLTVVKPRPPSGVGKA
jgi:RNA-directed DNA polymerase